MLTRVRTTNIEDFTIKPEDLDIDNYPGSPGDVLSITDDGEQFTLVANSGGGGTGGSLNDLDDVTLQIPLIDGESLVYESSTGLWTNKQASTVGGLDDLSDVTISSPVSRQALIFDGSLWINDNTSYNDLTDVPSSFPPNPHSHTISEISDWPFSDPPVISDMSDVSTSNVQPDEILVWNGSQFIPGRKASIRTSATANNLASFDSSGDIQDSGSAVGDFATASQGALADSAAQPGDNVSIFTNDAGYLTSAAQPGDNVSIFVNDAGYLTSADLPADSVISVFGRTGVVIAVDGDYDINEIANAAAVAISNDYNDLDNLPAQGATQLSELSDVNSGLSPIAGQVLKFDGLQWSQGDDDTVDGTNVGSGSGVFKQKVDSTLEFKTLIGGSNVTLTESADSITITSTSSGGGGLTDAFVSVGTESGTINASGPDNFNIIGQGSQLNTSVSGQNVIITWDAALNDLSDVNAATPNLNDSLVWTGSAWEPRDTSVDIDAKADKVVGAINGRLAGLDSEGNLTDSGSSPSSFATAAQGSLADSSIQPGDNVSILTNDAGYLQSGDNVSQLTNDAGYITSAAQPGDNVSIFVNDAGYLANITSESIGDLSDVNIGGITSGQILEWNGTQFIAVDNTGGGGDVSSVFGRTGDVSAVSGDYTSTQVTNSSSVVGTNVSNALNTLNNEKADTSSVPTSIDDLDDVDISGIQLGELLKWNGSSFVAAVDDDITSFIDLTDTPSSYSGQAGLVVKVRSDELGLEFVSESAQSVSSVFGRTGDVTASANDYNSGQVNDQQGSGGSSAPFTTVAQSLSNIWLGRTGIITNSGQDSNIITALWNSGNSAFQVSTSKVSDFATSAQGSLADSALQPGDNVSELVNDAGYITNGLQSGDNVSELINDANYTSSGDNVSLFVNDAGYITSADLPADAVTSVFGRTGDVIAASGDYNSGQVTNTSGVSGTTVSDALNSLNSNLGEDNTGANVGGGEGTVFRDKVGTTLNFKTLVAGTGVTITNLSNTIQLDATGAGGGESNTASNLGAGEGTFAQKNGVDLEFKSLIAGSDITLSSSGTEITINSTAAGGGIPDAPSDGTAYGRQDAGWVNVTEEAPNDGQQYARQSESWSVVTGGGGGESTFESIRVNYNAFGTITTVQDASAGITSTSIDSSQWVNFEFTYNRPPSSILYYGYKDLGSSGWGYKMTMPATSSMVNEVLTGGSSGAPAELLTNMSPGKIRLQSRTNETFADNGEHAYIFFLF